MAPFREELAAFVGSLAIPEDRRAVVLAELTDHARCAAEAAVRAGDDPDAAARDAIGDLATLRRALEAVERGFRVTRGSAIARGAAAAALIVVAVAVAGPFAAPLALAGAVALAPPRMLDLLRAELRAPRVRGALVPRGIPIGPAFAYLMTVMYAPFVTWTAIIVARVCAGAVDDVDVPWTAWPVLVACNALIVVELVRAQRDAARVAR